MNVTYEFVGEAQRRFCRGTEDKQLRLGEWHNLPAVPAIGDMVTLPPYKSVAFIVKDRHFDFRAHGEFTLNIGLDVCVDIPRQVPRLSIVKPTNTEPS